MDQLSRHFCLQLFQLSTSSCCRLVAGKIADNRTGDVACDHYHKWQEDIALMKSLGIKHYRLSISWPRVIPGGTAGSPVNEAGIAFYRNLIKGLLDAGIKPAVTM